MFLEGINAIGRGVGGAANWVGNKVVEGAAAIGGTALKLGDVAVEVIRDNPITRVATGGKAVGKAAIDLYHHQKRQGAITGLYMDGAEMAKAVGGAVRDGAVQIIGETSQEFRSFVVVAAKSSACFGMAGGALYLVNPVMDDYERACSGLTESVGCVARAAQIAGLTAMSLTSLWFAGNILYSYCQNPILRPAVETVVKTVQCAEKAVAALNEGAFDGLANTPVRKYASSSPPRAMPNLMGATNAAVLATVVASATTGTSVALPVVAATYAGFSIRNVLKSWVG